jgi:uncharacterized repeat protein (TIGR01451 family)
MKKWQFVLSVFVTIAIITTTITLVFAAGDAVTTTLTASKVTTDASGSERLVPADKVTAGDIMQYTVTVTNNSATPVTNIAPVLPIPAGTVYVMGSARPTAVLASTDGKTYEKVPLLHAVKQADGSVKQLRVPVEQYRDLRWQFASLDAHHALVTSARVTVTRTATASH